MSPSYTNKHMQARFQARVEIELLLHHEDPTPAESAVQVRDSPPPLQPRTSGRGGKETAINIRRETVLP